MRYVFAVLIAGIIVALGWLFVWHTKATLAARINKELKDIGQAGELPPELEGVDVDTLDPSDMGFELSAVESFRIGLADLMSNLAFLLIPMVFAVCLSAAALLGLWPTRAGVTIE